jgi:phosphatidylserine/phosphatidylglycerophosphate/cardiolipin synthase-like enzyme
VLLVPAGHPLAAAPPPAVELIETVPVETRLGNPELRSAHDAWLELIRGAQRTVDLEEFYFSDWPGEPLRDIVDALGQTAARGVRVRLLLDAAMYRTYPMPADSLAKLPNVEVRRIDIRRIAGGVQHAKFFTVDGQATVIGSQNLDWRSLKHIHELGVVLRDPRATRAFQRVFELDWEAAGLQAAGRDSAAVRALAFRAPLTDALPWRIARVPGDTVDVWPGWTPKVFAPDSTHWDLERIVSLIDGARHEVVLQSLHLTSEGRNQRDERIEQALRRAAARGVRVRAAISDWTVDGRGIQSLQALSKVPGIEAKLSVVPEWSGGYIPFARLDHSKYMVVDTLYTWVGTSNWEPGYFLNTRNLGVTMRNRTIAAQARRTFESSWTSPTAVAVKADTTYAKRVHGDTPPPGMKAYGR